MLCAGWVCLPASARGAAAGAAAGANGRSAAGAAEGRPRGGRGAAEGVANCHTLPRGGGRGAAEGVANCHTLPRGGLGAASVRRPRGGLGAACHSAAMVAWHPIDGSLIRPYRFSCWASGLTEMRRVPND
jgi:hypothetical protein